MSTTPTASATSVLNLRLDDATKAAIASEAIRDGRSMSQIALRAIKLGLAQMIQPASAPATKAKPAAKAKAKPAAKAKRKKGGDEGAAGALAPAK